MWLSVWCACAIHSGTMMITLSCVYHYPSRSSYSNIALSSHSRSSHHLTIEGLHFHHWLCLKFLQMMARAYMGKFGTTQPVYFSHIAGSTYYQATCKVSLSAIRSGVHFPCALCSILKLYSTCTAVSEVWSHALL